MRQSFYYQTYGSNPTVSIRNVGTGYDVAVFNLRTQQFDVAGNYPSFRQALESLPEGAVCITRNVRDA